MTGGFRPPVFYLSLPCGGGPPPAAGEAPHPALLDPRGARESNPVLATHARPSLAVSSHVKREFRVCEPSQSGGVSVFPFASPHSPNKSKEAERRQTLIRILRTIGRGSALLGQLACRRSTTVLAQGSCRPKGAARANGFLRRGWSVWSISSPQPGGADLAQFERLLPRPSLSQSSEHLASRS